MNLSDKIEQLLMKVIDGELPNDREVLLAICYDAIKCGILT